MLERHPHEMNLHVEENLLKIIGFISCKLVIRLRQEMFYLTVLKGNARSVVIRISVCLIVIRNIVYTGHFIESNYRLFNSFLKIVICTSKTSRTVYSKLSKIEIHLSSSKIHICTRNVGIIISSLSDITGFTGTIIICIRHNHILKHS